MKTSYYWSHTLRQGVASLLMVATLATWFAWPQTTIAATVLSDGFGTGNNANNISDWNEEGNDNDSSTLAREGQVNGADVVSPNGGRFAKIAKGEWICRQIDAENRYNLTLKYYWNGDADAENGQDDGVVEYRTTSNGNTDNTCNSNANSWEELETHDLHDDTNWSGLQTIELPDELDDDDSWFIRFRNDATGDDEFFRVDGILIEGDLPDTEQPTVTINQAAGQSDPTGSSPIEFTVVFSEPVSGFTDGDVLLSGTAGATSANVSGGPTTFSVDVSGMTQDGTVIATVPAGAAEDGAGNDSLASGSTDNQVTYNLPNQAPTADSQSVETDEDTPVNITLTANDPDGDPLSWSIVIEPDHGDLTGTAPNLTYTPDDDYNGSDDFHFVVNDGTVNSDAAIVDIDIDPMPETCPNGQVWTESGCVPVQVDEPTEPGQCIVVSDTTDFYVEGGTNAVLTYVHPAWADLVTGASWIWGDAEVVDPSVNETQTFTKTFYLEEAPTNADLELAADNGALVKINGTTVLDQLTGLDGSDQNYNDPADSVDVTSELQLGANTIEITVTNLAYATSDPHVNPAGLLYRLVVDGSDCGEPQDEVPQNSCVDPSAEGAPEAAIPLFSSPLEEDELQEILDDEYGANAPDAATEQDNYQEWSGTGNTVTFTVKNISAGSNSGHSHVFGYYLNGGSFTPVFREGLVGAPYDTATDLTYGASTSFIVANVNTLVFAMADWDGTDYDYYATDRTMNAGSEDHAIVYNVDDDLYAIAFEDLPFASGDEDYNDVAVSLHVDECEAGTVCEPGVELLENGTFEIPEVGASFWDIFNLDSDPNLAWAAEWLNPVGAPEIANIELQETGLGGWSATGDGDQWTELDSDWNGHDEGPNNEAGQVAISQTIDTVPGETYTLSFDFSPRPQTAASQNKVEVLVNDVVFGTVGPLATAGNQTEWTSHTFSFVADSYSTVVSFRDAGVPSDSLGTFVDNASLMCEEPEPTATIVATKIVCPTEASLPNWGAGNVLSSITDTTDEDFLAEHPECHVEEWEFQWATDAAGDPEDNGTTALEAPWTSFSGATEVPVDINLRLREVLQEGYIGFTGQNTDQDVSAEFYCGSDVLNYDNWEWIDGTQADATYYCVAFNAPTDEGEQCNPTASTVLLSSDEEDGSLLTFDESGPASLVGEFIHSSWADTVDALWIWKDEGTSAEDAANGTTETFTRTFDIIGTPLDSTLELAVDNAYEVKVNGTTVCADAGEHNYEATTTCAVPASVLLNGENEITFEVINIDHASANDPENNPAGLLYKLTVNENECEVPPAPYSSVTMCKTDVQGNPLSGWTLMLQGEEIETLAVAVNDINGSDTLASLEGGLSYLAIASGLWLNSGQTGNWVDAEYSTVDGWSTPIDGFVGYSTDILELQINESFDPTNDWGPYNAAHVYAQSFLQPSNGPANFRVFDGHPVPVVQAGWYGDNVQSTLAVDLFEGYAGVTGEDGCVVFDEVPYGTYAASELMQDGWTHYATWDAESVIDGSSIVVNESEEYFTIQNRLIEDGEEGDENTGTLVIEKRSQGGDGIFEFNVGGNESLEEVFVETEEGDGSESIDLAPGIYSLTEIVPEGWTLESVTCDYGEESEVSLENGGQVIIVEDEEVTCTFVNEESEEEINTFLSGGGGGENHNMGGGGSVLGAATEACEALLSTYLRMGLQNDETEVTELQTFLNNHMNAGLPVTGFFGPLTHNAVKTFQLLYWQEVLQPWFTVPGSAILDQDDATGFVYKTTQRMVNNIFCPSLNLPMPTLP